jgi:hypothetical protein
MTCPAAFTISDGTTTVSIPLAATTGTYQIAREMLEAGSSVFRAASGVGWRDVLWERTRWTITGSGLADPGLYALDITADSWSVTIPGFADDGIDETWTVIPARPSQSRERRAGVQSWTLTLEQAD